MNNGKPARKRNRMIRVLAVIAPIVAGAAIYYAFKYVKSDDRVTTYNVQPTAEGDWTSEWFNEVIYFESGSFFDGDHWVWIDAVNCPVTDENSPWTLAWRDAQGGDFSYAEQIGFVNSNWRSVYEEFSFSEDVGMIAVNPVTVGFRLPDDSSDADLEAFAIRLDAYLWEHDPCPMGSRVPADV